LQFAVCSNHKNVGGRKGRRDGGMERDRSGIGKGERERGCGNGNGNGNWIRIGRGRGREREGRRASGRERELAHLQTLLGFTFGLRPSQLAIECLVLLRFRKVHRHRRLRVRNAEEDSPSRTLGATGLRDEPGFTRIAKITNYLVLPARSCVQVCISVPECTGSKRCKMSAI
jgi:hypothetical protein